MTLLDIARAADEEISAIHAAFGAPGNYGYSTPEGKALFSLYKFQTELRNAIRQAEAGPETDEEEPGQGGTKNDRPAIYAALAFIALLIAVVSLLLTLLGLFFDLPLDGTAVVWGFPGGMAAWAVFARIDARKGPHG